MIHNVKLLWIFTFLTAAISYAADCAGFVDALALSLFLSLIAAGYLLMATADLVLVLATPRPVCGDNSRGR